MSKFITIMRIKAFLTILEQKKIEKKWLKRFLMNYIIIMKKMTLKYAVPY